MFRKWPGKRPARATGLPRLLLPPPAAGCHPKALISAAELRTWLRQLPNVNAVRTTAELLGQVSLLAHYPGALPQLERLLQLLQAPVDQLDHAVVALVNEPDNAAGQRTLAQLLPLYGELTLALAQLHKRQINAGLDRAKGPSVDQLYAAAVVLARHLRLELFHHQPPPPQTWRDLLRLYEIAAFLERAAVRASQGTRAAPDVHSLFFGNLLFLLADPLHLAPATAWAMFDAAVQLAHLVEFEAGGQRCADGIPVDMTGACPPLTLARQPELAVWADCRCLRLGPLLRHLESQAGVPGDAPAAALHAALRTLATQHGRVFPRHPRSAEYRLFAGLHAIQQRLVELAGGPAAPPPAPAPGRPRALPQAAPPPPQICRQINYSVGGAAFLLELRTAARLDIGTLVLFETGAPDNPQRQVGFVGRVRRRLQRGEGLLEIGVEKLGGRVFPVTISAHRGSGLALLHQETDSQALELYAPSGSFRAAAVLELNGPAGPQRVRLGSLREQTGEIERIAVMPDSA